MGDVEETDEEVSSEFSATYTYNICRDSEIEELMLIHPYMNSPEEKQNMCFKNVILKTWLLLDSQPIDDVMSNVDLLTKITKSKLHSESDVMQD